MIALNAMRLYLISLGPEEFSYWHNGFGAEIFSAVSTLIIAAMCIWGAARDDARDE